MGDLFHETVDEAEPKGRRVRLIHVSPHDLVSLFAGGGLFQVSRSLPADATLAGAWVDTERYQLRLAAHSNSFGLVRLGDVIEDVGPVEIVSLIARTVELQGMRVRPTDLCFTERGGGVKCDDGDEAGWDGVTGWLCSRCRELHPPDEERLVRQVPLVYRFCRKCAG